MQEEEMLKRLQDSEIPTGSPFIKSFLEKNPLRTSDPQRPSVVISSYSRDG
jgi:hypothetical protein